MPLLRRWLRISREECALSARTASGLVRGRPRRRGTRRRAMTLRKAGASPACADHRACLQGTAPELPRPVVGEPDAPWTALARRGPPATGSPATRADTSEFVPTSVPSNSRQIRSLHRGLHLARSLAGSSATRPPHRNGIDPAQGRSGPLPRTGRTHRTCSVLRRDPHRFRSVVHGAVDCFEHGSPAGRVHLPDAQLLLKLMDKSCR